MRSTHAHIRTAHRASASNAAVVREAVFAAQGLRLDAAVASSRGRHTVNEDWHSPLDDGSATLFAVADGVGRGAMASHASRELVTRLHAALENGDHDADTVCRALLEADREIARSIANRTDAPGAATVALCARTDATGSRWLVAWVGDCRVYRLRTGGDAPAELLTLDDTYRHLNETPPSGGSPDDPARMVGNGAVDRPNVRSIDLGGDEMLLLCSDGVHRHVEPAGMARLLRGSGPLVRRCVRIIEFVRRQGSSDDATVLVVHRGQPHPSGQFARRIFMAALIVLIASALLWLATDSGVGASPLRGIRPSADRYATGERSHERTPLPQARQNEVEPYPSQVQP
jgi:protein phosphatase